MRIIKRLVFSITAISFAILALSLTTPALSFNIDLIDSINITFSQGEIPSGNNVIFDDISYNDVALRNTSDVIVPGTNFSDVVSTHIKDEYNNTNIKLDPETFYFDVDGTNWAYTFTGWHIVGTSDYLPSKTVFQPGDLILKDVLEQYIDENNNELKLEAVWAKCYFIRNPYEKMIYSYDATLGYILDDELSLEASNGVVLSSDDNDGRTPETPKASIDGLYEVFAKKSYTDKTQDPRDGYATAVMFVGDVDYYKDTNGKVYNAKNTLVAVGAYFGQKINNISNVFISATYKSLQGLGDTPNTYDFYYKPKGYFNQVYGNLRFDNINFVLASSTTFGGQARGSEFQLYSLGSGSQYFEITARYNRSLSSGQAHAITTFRPSDIDLVVINGGTFGSMQTTWQTAISEAGNTIEWYVGRNAKITSALHCGFTSPYAENEAVVNVNFKVRVTGGKVVSIYGGNRGLNTKCIGNRDINIIGDGTTTQTEYNPEIGDIYGGADQSVLYGDINLSINNCQLVNNIYGGGNMYTATTYGNINIDIKDSRIKGDLYGGGKNANSEKTDTIDGGNVTINIDNSKVLGNIFGSGMGMTQTFEQTTNIGSLGQTSNWWDVNVYPDGLYLDNWEIPLGSNENGELDPTLPEYYPQYDPETGYVLISGFKTLSWSEHGAYGLGFKHTMTYAYLSLATVENVEININDSVIGTSYNQKGNVYGGGSIAQVLGDTEINISGDKTIIYGAVYGGGDGDSVPASVTVYKPLDASKYVAPSYTVEITETGVPKVTVKSQSPAYTTSSYGSFTWSNDTSLLDSSTPGIDLDKKLLYSPNTIGLGKVVGNTAVNISGGKIIGNVYGGGNKGIVDGDTNLTISGTTQIEYAYAGGNQANVNGISKLTINGGTVKNAFGGNNITGNITSVSVEINGGTITNLYGGGNQAADDYVNEVLINDGTITNLFGGGLQALVGSTNVLINGGIIDTVYGGGYAGDVQASTEIIIYNGTINKNIYGGGYQGNVDAVNITIGNDTGITMFNSSTNVILIKGNVYGGGYAGNVENNANVNVFDGTIKGNVYGGGYAGDVNQTSVIIEDINSNGNIMIGQNVFGAGEGLSATVYTLTEVTINLNLETKVTEAPIDTEHLSGKSDVEVEVLSSVYSKIGGSVYGGGDLGQVGSGTINSSNNIATDDITGSTNVLVKNGYIGGSVYGGGSGVPKSEDQRYTIEMGTIFGSTNVTINGGYILENVFGGGTQSRVYESTKVDKEATIVNVTENGNNIVVRGSVFGGGQRSNSATTNASIPTVVGDVIVNINGIDGTSSKIYFEKGGVYGDGNLCLVEGTKTININHFTTDGTTLKTFYSLQRADVVNINDSDFVLLGAVDLVEEGDATVYSVNRIKQLNMNDGSTIKLDQIVKYLGNIKSDIETDRKFIIEGNNGTNSDNVPDDLEYLGREDINEVKSYIESVGKYANKNVICVANGLYLEILQENNEYGAVTGLFTLQLLEAVVGEGGGFVYASIQYSTGDFICETLMTTSSGDVEYYMPVVDNTAGYVDGIAQYYCWYIQGDLINFEGHINGYIGSDKTSYELSTIMPEHEETLAYVLKNIIVNDVLENAIKNNKYNLVSTKEEVEKLATENSQGIAIELRLGNVDSWYLCYDKVNEVWSIDGKVGYKEDTTISPLLTDLLIETSDITGENANLTVILHKSKAVDAEVNNMQIHVELVRFNPDGTEYSGTSNLVYKMGFAISRLVPVQDMYIGASKNYSGLTESKPVNITLGSSFTVEYQTKYIPSAFPSESGDMNWVLQSEIYRYFVDELGNYLTLDSNDNVINISPTLTLDPSELDKVLVTKDSNNNYQYEHDSKQITLKLQNTAKVTLMPKGTKITLVDLSIDSLPGYYYYICQEDLSYINLEDFMYMGTTTKIKDGTMPSFVSLYENTDSLRITERLIFIFDFEQVEFANTDTTYVGNIVLSHNYTNSASNTSDIMDYVKSETSLDTTSHTRSYPKEAEYKINLDEDEDGIGEFTAKFDNDEYFDVSSANIIVNVTEDELWENTKLDNGNIGIIIKPTSGEKLPEGIEFVYKNVSYYPINYNQYAIIPIKDFGEHRIFVKNLLGTIGTNDSRDSANFEVAIVYLPSNQYNNDDALLTQSTISISCDIISTVSSSLYVEIKDRIIEQGENITATVKVQNSSSYQVYVAIYGKTAYGGYTVGYVLPSITGSSEGSICEVDLSNWSLDPGTYMLVFSIGGHEEIIHIIIK